jgi:hypothetical protein
LIKISYKLHIFTYTNLQLINFNKQNYFLKTGFHYAYEVILFHLIIALFTHIINLVDIQELNNSKIIFKIEAFDLDTGELYNINFEYTLNIFNLSAETFTNKLNQYLEKENIPHCLCEIIDIEVSIEFNKKLEN